MRGRFGRQVYIPDGAQRCSAARVYGLGLHLGSGLDLLAEPATRDTSQGQDNYKTTTRQLQDNYKTTTRQPMMLPEATLLVLGA